MRHPQQISVIITFMCRGGNGFRVVKSLAEATELGNSSWPGAERPGRSTAHTQHRDAGDVTAMRFPSENSQCSLGPAAKGWPALGHLHATQKQIPLGWSQESLWVTCRALGMQAGVWAHARWASLRAFPPPSAVTCEGSQASAELREGSCLLTRCSWLFTAGCPPPPAESWPQLP